jgi:hypothetical protein
MLRTQHHRRHDSVVCAFPSQKAGACVRVLAQDPCGMVTRGPKLALAPRVPPGELEACWAFLLPTSAPQPLPPAALPRARASVCARPPPAMPCAAPPKFLVQQYAFTVADHKYRISSPPNGNLGVARSTAVISVSLGPLAVGGFANVPDTGVPTKISPSLRLGRHRRVDRRERFQTSSCATRAAGSGQG